jgi:hypothetical protein
MVLGIVAASMIEPLLRAKNDVLSVATECGLAICQRLQVGVAFCANA